MNELARLTNYTEHLTRVFRDAPDKHAAHRKSAEILRDLAADPGCLTAALRNHLQRPDVLNTPSFNTLGFDVVTNPHFVLVVNGFLPSPTGECDVTTNSIHHHGDMLLSTVTAFGPGYEHWRFTPPEIVDPGRDLFRCLLIDRRPHPVGDLAFVDTRMMHAVVYPRSLSMTFALWSSKNRVSWLDHVKRLSLLRAHTSKLQRIASRLGLARALQVKVIEYFDFYPTTDGLKGMRERVQFRTGPNEDYLLNLFHVIQQTGNEPLMQDVERALEPPSRIANPDLVRRLLQDVKTGRPIPSKVSKELHFGIPHMNFRTGEIEALLGRTPPLEPVAAR